MTRAIIRNVVGLALTVLAGTGVASNLSDPTRPVDYFAPAAAAKGEARSYGPVLQSTMVSPLRKRAVIDGKTVAVGDKVSDAQIVDIRPYEVILRRGNQQSSLRLMPKLGKETKLAKEKGTSE